ncbi:MAG: preprotein translocase subunit SecA, partial [Alphaproteobacteria bacterium]|nr:preprotein translocase subunit SecA [Alphaproteobacteria bacterium]
MLKTISKRIVGSANERVLRRMSSDVRAIGAIEDEIRALSDDNIRSRFAELREKARAGTPPDDLLVPCFALVREAARRTLGQRHFDVQLTGGMVLHRGMIAEMKTGEGKTLAATPAIALNALAGKGAHVVTVNDYLARRDSEWMGEIYHFLGLTVGCIVPGMDDDSRRAAYARDVTYTTNSEIGFDYLRDNMKYRDEDMVQRPFNFAVVDEVDSILIDEARTPLIISGPSEESSEMYVEVSRVVSAVSEEHY